MSINMGIQHDLSVAAGSEPSDDLAYKVQGRNTSVFTFDPNRQAHNFLRQR